MFYFDDGVFWFVLQLLYSFWLLWCFHFFVIRCYAVHLVLDIVSCLRSYDKHDFHGFYFSTLHWVLSFRFCCFSLPLFHVSVIYLYLLILTALCFYMFACCDPFDLCLMCDVCGFHLFFLLSCCNVGSFHICNIESFVLDLFSLLFAWPLTRCDIHSFLVDCLNNTTLDASKQL